MIRLERELALRIREEGEKAYPHECCGFVLGSIDGSAHYGESILAVENRGEITERYHRFVISPEDFMQAETAAAQQGRDIAGIYHSHPDHPAVPSEYDREHALPLYSYIIVSVEKGKAVSLASWLLHPGREGFTEEAVELVQQSGSAKQVYYFTEEI